jgi:thiol-disulfide isomerase/thioredoxin
MNVVAYHFWSPTCGPCTFIKPAIAELKNEFNQIKWISVNTREDPNGYAGKFGVSVVPTIVATVVNPNGTIKSAEKHSGTQMIGYHRILKNSIRSLTPQ